MDKILAGTCTFDGKDYCLEKWSRSFKAVVNPATAQVQFLVLDNSEDINHYKTVSKALEGMETDGAVLHVDRLGMCIRELLASSYDYLRERAIKDFDYLFTVEADNYPPPEALVEMYDFLKHRPDVGVVACQTGYPEKAGEDGSQNGFYKWMAYRFLEPEEQEYDEIEAMDTEAIDRLRPRINRADNGWFVVANNAFMMDKRSPDGKFYYSGKRENLAIQKFKKAMNEFVEPPMKVHRIPKMPPVLPVEPDLEKPARVEGLHLGCTLIRKSVLKEVPFRWSPEETVNCDQFFFEDCKAKNIEVWSLPIVVRHEHRMWDRSLKR